MGYVALTAFLEPISPKENIPDESKTPEYWADKLGREWSLLGASALSGKLLPFFVEFNRLCEAEKAAIRRETDNG